PAPRSCAPCAWTCPTSPGRSCAAWRTTCGGRACPTPARPPCVPSPRSSRR
ncbi:unnamed protein product, partial [Heterosigma akashiwo]